MAMAESCREMGWIGSLEPNRVSEALDSVRWVGRLSQTEIGGRPVLLDGAHNLEAAESLAAFLKDQAVRYNLVFACLDDKPVREMADILRPVVGEVAVCRLQDPRGLPVEALLEVFPGARAYSNPVDAVRSLGHPVLAAGSLRLVGALLNMGG